jgi:hypothetical protein
VKARIGKAAVSISMTQRLLGQEMGKLQAESITQSYTGKAAVYCKSMTQRLLMLEWVGLHSESMYDSKAANPKIRKAIR